MPPEHGKAFTKRFKKEKMALIGSPQVAPIVCTPSIRKQQMHFFFFGSSQNIE